MGVALAVVHLPDVNGMPADDTENTFCFASAGHSPEQIATEMLVHLKLFYNAAHAPGVDPIAFELSKSLDRGTNKASVVWYQLAAQASMVPVTPLGSPFTTDSFTLGAADFGSSDLPRECAAVLSYHGDLAGLAEDTPGGVAGPKGDTHPAARHRGRIYLGPLQSGALGAGVNGPGISSSFRDSATGAAKFLAGAGTLALEGASWSVWSRKNAACYLITGGFMDDAFDTQRRRGIGASTRTSWTTV